MSADITETLTPTQVIAQPLTLPCGLVLPNRLVKCPMQETLADAPLYDPPIEKFKNLYGKWAESKYGLIITGQVQVDIRCKSLLLQYNLKPVKPCDKTYMFYASSLHRW